MKKVFHSKSLEETAKIAAQWLTHISLVYDNTDEALVVGLNGHLGAGKTAFVKCVAKELGIEETVTSPTFVLMKIYEIDAARKSPWKHLVHIDAYRLERQEELQALNWEQLVSDKNNLVLVEWPENVGLNKFKNQANLAFEIIENVHHVVIS